MPERQSIAHEKGVEDPFDVVNIARVRKGKISKLTTEPLAWDAFQDSSRSRRKKRVIASGGAVRSRSHPVLRKWIAERPDDREQVLVSFRDDLNCRAFPTRNLKRRAGRLRTAVPSGTRNDSSKRSQRRGPSASTN